MLELCKAVLTVGDPEAKALASVELAALTLEDISARIARLAEAQGARTGDVPKAVRNAQRALKQECDRLAACLPSALSRWGALSLRLHVTSLHPCSTRCTSRCMCAARACAAAHA